jgi:hypothetical protein
MKQNENDQSYKKESMRVVDNKPNGKSRMRVRNIKKGLFICLGIILIYFLSIGPAHRLLCENIFPDKMFFFIYDPLLYVCKQNEHLDSMLNRYEDLWYSMWDQPAGNEPKK